MPGVQTVSSVADKSAVRPLFVVLAVVPAVAAVITIVAAITVLGAIAPGLPFIGTRGSTILSLFAPGLLLVILASCAIMIAAGMGTAVLGRGLVIIGLITALGTAIYINRMVALAQENGVGLALSQKLWPAETLFSEPTQDIVQITDDAGDVMPIAYYQPATNTAGAPVMIYIHGGAFTGGSHLMRASDMRWFADQGFVVFSIGYGLSNASDARWDRALGQIGCAMGWINANAADFGGNGGKVAIFGDSAGGNLALNAAYRSAAGTMPTTCSGDLPQVAAVTAMYPVVSVADWYNDAPASTRTQTRRTASLYMGGTPQQFPDRYASVNPVTHLTAAAPPTLVLHGTNDSIVPLASSHYLQDRAHAAGVDLRLITMPLAEHAFDMRGSISNDIVRQTSRDFIRAALTP